MLGDIALPNRVVMAPMARARCNPASRSPEARVADYYAQRAAAGLIITEATHVGPLSVSRPGGAAIHTPAQVQGWRLATDAVHAANGRIFQQLYHVGRKAARADMPGRTQPVGPSTARAVGEVTTQDGKQPFAEPRALTAAEIADVVTGFGAAARASRTAGFDGIEVHAANGYLIDQFLRGGRSQRSDRYGGSIANRVRLLAEVLDAVAEAFPAGRTGLRISPDHLEPGISDEDAPALFSEIARQVSDRGLAYLHIALDGMAGNGAATARYLRTKFNVPMICCGGFDRAGAERALASDCADAVAFGTLFIANPDLVARFASNGPFNTPRRELYRHGGDEGYVDYPTLRVLEAPAGA